MLYYPPPCECTTVCLGSVNWPLSCLSDIRMPLRCLGSGLECLLDGYKDPPKTAGVESGPIRGHISQSVTPLLEAFLTTKTPQDAPKTAQSFFDAIFNRSWLEFAFQLGSQNPSKSMKNPCEDAFACWPLILIDFSLIFAPNFDPPDLVGFSCGKTLFFQTNAFRR